MNDPQRDARIAAIPDVHGHAKGEHKPFAEERPIALSARMLFLWFFHACRRGAPRFLMVSDHMNYLTFEDPAAVNLVRRALKLAQAGDLYGAAETASVEVGHAAVVSEGLRRGMRYSIGAEVDNDPRCRPDAQNIVDAMKPDGMIRSVHFLQIDHPTLGANWNWPFDNPEFREHFETLGTERVWELYMTTLLDAVERLPGNIVGHFYVPAKFGHWPNDDVLERYEDQLIEAVARREMAIELNTRFLYRSEDESQRDVYRRANLRLLRKAKAAGVGIAIGSDAHSPRDQGNGFDEVLTLLDEAEINELVFPIGGRLLRVALRVVRERPESEPEPAEVPAAAAASAASIGDDHVAAEPAAVPAKRRAAKKPPKSAEPSPAIAAAELASAGAAPDVVQPAPAQSDPAPVTAAPLAEEPDAAAATREPALASAGASAAPSIPAAEPERARRSTAAPAHRAPGPRPRVSASSSSTAAARKLSAPPAAKHAPAPRTASAKPSSAGAKAAPAAAKAARTASKSSGASPAKSRRTAPAAKKSTAKTKRPAAKAPAKKAAAKKSRALRPAPAHKPAKSAAKKPAAKSAAKRTKPVKKAAPKKTPVKKPAAKRHR